MPGGGDEFVAVAVLGVGLSQPTVSDIAANATHTAKRALLVVSSFMCICLIAGTITELRAVDKVPNAKAHNDFAPIILRYFGISVKTMAK